jgi:hypothetical protein
MGQRIAQLQNQLDAALEMLAGVRSGLSELAKLGPQDEATVERIGTAAPFSFPWPSEPEKYTRATIWRIRAERGSVDVTVGRTRRRAWGRNRRRVVVFGPAAQGVSTRYPWAEFTETDHGQMSAIVPDPESPRRILRDGDALPPHYRGKTVARVDELFGSIRSGGSLRIVVEEEEEMVRHAHYMARLKKRA